MGPVDVTVPSVDVAPAAEVVVAELVEVVSAPPVSEARRPVGSLDEDRTSEAEVIGDWAAA